jgi:hypothetical protein
MTQYLVHMHILVVVLDRTERLDHNFPVQKTEYIFGEKRINILTERITIRAHIFFQVSLFISD